jgi:hypothetical protein
MLAACSRSPAAAADVASIPLASTSASIASEPVTAPPADTAGRVTATATGSWAAAFPAKKKVVTLDLPSASRIDIEWRVAERHRKKVPIGGPDTEYPIDFASNVDLVFRADGFEKTIPLGELSGFVDPSHISYCFSIGWHHAQVTTDGPPLKEPSIASQFWHSVTQGGDNFILVRDGDTLHLLHEDWSDGKCDDTTQGPLFACKGREWQRVADIRGVRGAALYEIVTYDHKPFDCGQDMYGSRLVRP